MELAYQHYKIEKESQTLERHDLALLSANAASGSKGYRAVAQRAKKSLKEIKKLIKWQTAP